MKFCTVDGRRVEYLRLPSSHPRGNAPAMVFLHEGLGSLSMWRDFPQQVADACGCEAIVYSRHGYGRSDPLTEKRAPGFMHHEARVCLPEFLDQLAVERPILLGHSDGASIALIHAGTVPRPLTATVVMAPHVLVEDISIASIQKAREAYLSTDLKIRLGKYHDDPDSAFWGWNDIWLDPAFRSWNIEAALPSIRCPVLAVQGEDDEYGTMAQVEGVARLVPQARLVKPPACGHSPHRDQPALVLWAADNFVRRIAGQLARQS